MYGPGKAQSHALTVNAFAESGNPILSIFVTVGAPIDLENAANRCSIPKARENTSRAILIQRWRFVIFRMLRNSPGRPLHNTSSGYDNIQLLPCTLREISINNWSK